jgi:cell division protein FtsB
LFSRIFSKKRSARRRKLRAEGEAAVRDRSKRRGARRAEVPLERPQLIFIMAAVGTAFIALVTLFGQRGALEVYALKRKIKATSEEANFYERQNKELRTLIKNLKQDPYTIEQIAREELGLVRPGETVYEFVDEAPPPQRPRQERP